MINPSETAEILKARFGPAILEAAVEADGLVMAVAAEHWPEVAGFLRDDARLRINMFRCLSGADLLPEPQIELLYELQAMSPAPGEEYWRSRIVIRVRLRVPRDGGQVRSVAGVWPAAEWHEREAFDLLGVRFEGHPNLRRILCPEDWVGHPLRKDYEFPREYQGIPAAADDAQDRGANQPS